MTVGSVGGIEGGAKDYCQCIEARTRESKLIPRMKCPLVKSNIVFLDELDRHF
jgi:hypothetical protein